jgi:HAD superfamily hydrolase (TIGR01549 family)
LREPLEAVLFDLDDTLHDDTATFERAAERVADEVAREYAVDSLALRQAYIAEAMSFWIHLSDRDLGVRLVRVRSQMWLRALRAVGLDDPALADRAADDYNRYRKDYLRPSPGALELLASLRARGLKLGMITNGFAETHREKITLLQLDDAFDEIFIADEVGMIKPDPRIFVHACGRLGTPVQRAAMVGDRYDRDIRGGQAAGLFTVWLNGRGERLPEGASPPDAVVGDIAAVADVLPP